MAWSVAALTSSNTKAINDEADALVAADSSGILQDFRSFADGSAASSSVTAEKIRCYDEAEVVLDTKEFFVWRAGGDRTAGRVAYEQHQADWLARRQAFEALWVDGESFVYFALNAGGLGTQGKFGAFCLVVPQPADRGRVVAVVPGDSLQRYTNLGTIDVARIEREAAAWTVRGSLTLIERHREALTVHTAGWQEVVCREDRYLETTLGPPLPLDDVTEIRLTEAYLRQLDDYDLRDFAGETLEPVAANELRAYRSLQRWRREYGLAIAGIR